MRNEHRHDQSTNYDYVGENVAATGKQGGKMRENVCCVFVCLCVYVYMYVCVCVFVLCACLYVVCT